MADNVKVQEATGSLDPPIATDDVGGAHYQKIKLALGAENAVDTLLDSGQQSMANSVPVVLAGDHSTIPVSEGAAANIGANQVSVSSSSGQIAPANLTRSGVILIHHGGNAPDVFYGPSGVAAGNGAFLPAVAGYQSPILKTKAAVHGVTVSGSATVSYVEFFN